MRGDPLLIDQPPPPASTDGVGQSQWDEATSLVAQTHAMKGFKGSYQYLELNPKASWHPCQLASGCNFRSSVITSAILGTLRTAHTTTLPTLPTLPRYSFQMLFNGSTM